jgi:hypothetical protein
MHPDTPDTVGRVMGTNRTPSDRAVARQKSEARAFQIRRGARLGQRAG